MDAVLEHIFSLKFLFEITVGFAIGAFAGVAMLRVSYYRAGEDRAGECRHQHRGALLGDNRVHEWVIGVRLLVFSKTGMIKHSEWQCLGNVG